MIHVMRLQGRCMKAQMLIFCIAEFCLKDKNKNKKGGGALHLTFLRDVHVKSDQMVSRYFLG